MDLVPLLSSNQFVLTCFYLHTVAPGSVSIIQSPVGLHFKGRSLTLTCFTFLDTVVDIAVQVSHDWIGSNGVVLSDTDQRSIGFVTGSQGRFESNLTFFSLQSSDSGNYYCSSVVRAETQSIFITSSAAKFASFLVNAGYKLCGVGVILLCLDGKYI